MAPQVTVRQASGMWQAWLSIGVWSFPINSRRDTRAGAEQYAGELRAALAALAAPQEPEPEDETVLSMVIAALRMCHEAMELHEKREAGVFHISQSGFRFIWDDARRESATVLSLLPEDAGRPIPMTCS